jgi:transposase-like protein
MIEFKGSHFEREVILRGVRWYVAYPISYRQLEEMMQERGVEVDHSTLNRWVLKYVPFLEQQFRTRAAAPFKLGKIGISVLRSQFRARIRDQTPLQITPGPRGRCGVVL